MKIRLAAATVAALAAPLATPATHALASTAAPASTTIAAAAFTTLGPTTAQASPTPGTVIPATSHYLGIGYGHEQRGLPALQGTALRSNHRCDWDDRWCRDDDDFDHFHHRDFDGFHHYHHRDFDDFSDLDRFPLAGITSSGD